MAWEPVWSGGSEAEAVLVAGRLRADGMRPRLHMSNEAGSPLQMRRETWIIYVPTRQKSRAYRSLRDHGEGNQLLDLSAKGLYREHFAIAWAGFRILLYVGAAGALVFLAVVGIRAL